MSKVTIYCVECGEDYKFNEAPHKKQTCAKCDFSCKCDKQMFEHIDKEHTMKNEIKEFTQLDIYTNLDKNYKKLEQIQKKNRYIQAANELNMYLKALDFNKRHLDSVEMLVELGFGKLEKVIKKMRG